jgi:hypothetical protein
MNQSTGALCYRVRQFFRALFARVSDEELEQAARILTPAALALFCSMPIQDQRHGLDVCVALQQAGHTKPDLLAAALLHDAGKAAARIPAGQRAVIVLLERFAPRLLARLSQGAPQGCALSLPKGCVLSPTKGCVLSPTKGCVLSLSKGWRRPFVVHARHPQVGARWAREAGCSPLTVALIRRHQDQLMGCSPLSVEEDRLLAALQAADSLN